MQKVIGIILNISNYKNSDCVFNILTKDELISVLGRGSLNFKSKTNRLNNPFIYGEFDLYEGPTKGYKLRDCEVFNYFNEKFISYEDHMIFNFLNELLFKIVVNSNSYDQYLESIINALKLYGTNKNNYDIVVTLYANLLKINGLCLNVKSCVSCGDLNESELISIDFLSGGTVCKHCLNESLEIMNIDEIKIYKKIFESNIVDSMPINLNLDKKTFIKIIENLSIFLNTTLDINLKSLSLIKSI